MNERESRIDPKKDEERDLREPYERPHLTKKRSVARVTLFSGSGASGASGLTSA